MTRKNNTAPRPVLLYQANIITLDPNQPRARAMLLKNGRIVALFDDDKVPRSQFRNGETQHIDMQGLTLIPGMHDAHLHVQALGALQRLVDLRRTNSKAACLDLIKHSAANVAKNKTLFGFGWNDKNWPGTHGPTRDDLDRCCPGRVVVMMRTDGHAAWVSSAALQQLAIDDKSLDPSGGHIQRDSTGRATGLLIDRAADLARALENKATAQELKRDWLAGIDIASHQGLTSLHAMSIDVQSWKILQTLDAENLLDLRVFAYLDAEVPELDEMLAHWPRDNKNSRAQLVGVKLMLDGALGSRGAALCEDYLDAPGDRGLLLWPEKRLHNTVKKVQQAGLQLALHAIGDRANKIALDLLEACAEASISRRHRIEHAQILRSEDFIRFARLGLVASMQPSHLLSDHSWATQSLGAERMRNAYAWNKMAQHNIHLAFGSDAPIEAADPLLALQAACGTDSEHCGKTRPNRCLSRAQALRAICQGPSWAVQQENELGTLRPGMYADMSMLSADPLDEKVDLELVHVVGNIVAGHLRFIDEKDKLRPSQLRDEA